MQEKDDSIQKKAISVVDEYSMIRLREVLGNIRVVIKAPGITAGNVSPMVEEFNYHVRVLAGVDQDDPYYQQNKLRLRTDPTRGLVVYRGSEIDID